MADATIVQRSTLRAMLIAGFGLGGCVGQLGAIDDPPTTLDLHEKPTVPEALCTKTAVGPGPLRRLTAAQLRATVADLVGADIIDFQLQKDSSAGAFRSNADAPMQWANASDLRDIGEKAAVYVEAHLGNFVSCKPSTVSAESTCLKGFLDDFGRRAFRRPLLIGERANYEELFHEARTKLGLHFPGALRLVTAALLQSPGFAYHVELGTGVAAVEGRVPLTGYELASRMSYFVWGSMPDDELLAAAQAGELDDAEKLTKQVERMLDDPRGRSSLNTFFDQWLGLEDVSTLKRDAALFPQFDAKLAQTMRESTEAFIADVLWNGDARLETLLDSPVQYVNATLAPVLGLEGDFGDELERTVLDSEGRHGLLSHPSILAANSHQDQSSPVLRGKFVRARLLCDELPPPPPELNVDAIELDPALTPREQLESLMKPECMSCHQKMNPIGFSMEKFDAIGRFRDTQKGKPIDDSGEIVGPDANPFKGVDGLSEQLSQSNQVSQCAEEQMLTFALGRETESGELCTLGAELVGTTPGELDFKVLIKAIVTSDAFRYVRVEESDACD